MSLGTDCMTARAHMRAARPARCVMLCRRVPLGNIFALLTLSPAPNWLALHRARLSVADSPLPGSDPESESSPSSSSSSPSSLSSASVSSVLSRLAALPYSPSSRWPASSGVDMLGGGSGGRSDSVCSWSLWHVHAENDPFHGCVCLSPAPVIFYIYVPPSAFCYWWNWSCALQTRRVIGRNRVVNRQALSRLCRGVHGGSGEEWWVTYNAGRGRLKPQRAGKSREGGEHRCECAASWKEKSSLSSVMPGLPRNMVGFRKTAHCRINMFLISSHYIYI